jgi:peptidoglycan/LPS O-acetylase OafA/YrhL
VRPSTQVRLAFIDNLRTLLVVLVILFHLANTYGGEGSWHYHEGRADTITFTLLTLFVAVNQAFFMGFYFLIAAYFVPRSLESRGSRRFLVDRFLRLGVPLVFQLLVIAPLLSYCLGISLWGFEGSLWTYVAQYWKSYQSLDTGPLWFVEALLIFSMLYALWWLSVRPRAHQVQDAAAAPGNLAIAAFALSVGLASFTVRIWLPVGWYFRALNFQIAHFPQYISLFVLGTIAYRRGWLPLIAGDAARGRLWGRVVALLVALAPVLFVAGGALGGDTSPFMGGLHWQALTYALWEQLLCAAVVISLLVRFRGRHDHQGGLARELSASAYAVYVCHAPILVLVALGLRPVDLYALLKFALATLICLPICFVAGGLVRRLPGVNRIL